MRRRFAFLLSTVCSLGALADEITLKDGRVIEGDVVSDDGTTVKIKMRKGNLSVAKKDVASIVEKPTADQEYEKRAAALDAKSPTAQLALAKWCVTQLLEEEATKHFLLAAQLDPSLKEAATELEKRDYHLVGTVWMDPDTYYPTRGWQKLGKTWYPPKEYPWRCALLELDKANAVVAGDQKELDAEKATQDKLNAQMLVDQKKSEDAAKVMEKSELELQGLQREAEAAQREVARADEKVKVCQGQIDTATTSSQVLALQTDLRKLKSALGAAQGAQTKADKLVADKQKKLADLQATITEAAAHSASLSGVSLESVKRTLALQERKAADQAKADEARAKADALKAEMDKAGK